MKLFQRKKINCCVCNQDITNAPQWIIKDGFICTDCQDIIRKFGFCYPEDIQNLHISEIEEMRDYLESEGAPTLYQGWGGNLVVYPNDVTIRTNFPKKSFEHVLIKNVFFQEPQGANNGFLIIYSSAGKFELAFMANERSLLSKAYFHLLQLTPQGHDLMDSLLSFEETKIIAGILHIDETNEKWYIGKTLHDCKKIYNNSDIEKVAILKGNKMITSISSEHKDSSLMRGIIGGVIAGGTGAIIGSLTAPSETNSHSVENQTMYVNIFVVSEEDPISLSCPNELVADTLQRSLAKMMEIQTTQSSSETPTTSSITEEIRNYKKLLDDGIITQEDFDLKKKQLLGL